MLKELKQFYKTDARKHLPWRQTHDPYQILVSEIMLQQTQVDRVIPYYERWIKKYPTAKHLAKASLVDVLKMWQGLGYNRRAKYLWESAKVMSEAKVSEKSLGAPPQRGSRGLFKETFASLKLPGVGPYTRAAVETFAFNKPNVFIETNIRTVFFYHQIHSNVLQNNRMISDAQLMPLVAEALKKSKMEPRDFYAALMDYGSYLKKSGVKLNKRSKHYTKQTKFEGSARQLRGAILRELLKASQTKQQLIKNLYPRKQTEIVRELARLVSEGMLKQRGASYRVD